MELIFTVDHQNIKRIDTNKVVADSKNYLYAKFVFLSEEWQGKTVTAIFKRGTEAYHVLLDSNMSCLVPAEVIKPNGFNVSVFAGDLVTCDKANVLVAFSGYADGGAVQPPTPDIYAQILARLDSISAGTVDEETVAAAVESCIQEHPELIAGGLTEDAVTDIVAAYVTEHKEELKGEPGEKGDPGADGITPHIGENGNWFIGDEDTGQPAGGGKPTDNVKNDSMLMTIVSPDSLSSEWYDIYKYPPLPTWGNEYLYSWYEKLYNGDSVTICAEGDSTTYEGFWNTGGERRTMLDKIMKLGNYSAHTIVNCGFGSATSGHWVGTWNEDGLNELSNPQCTKSLYPNGTLDTDMSKNPDLMIWSFGINDASINLFPDDTIAQKLARFKANLTEGLQRIRGSEAVNGRPAYNRGADELAIILCVPLTTYTPDLGKTRDLWTKYTRRIVQEACREYKCAFWDISMRHFDHEFSDRWSVSTSGTGYDGTHPRPACNADFVSSIQDLLFPVCLWKEKASSSDSDSGEETATTVIKELSDEGMTIDNNTGSTKTSSYVYGVTDYVPASIGDKLTVSAFAVSSATSCTFFIYDSDKNYLAGISSATTSDTTISAGQTVDTTNKFLFDFEYVLPNDAKITNAAYVRAVSWKNDLIDISEHPFYLRVEHNQ